MIKQTKTYPALYDPSFVYLNNFFLEVRTSFKNQALLSKAQNYFIYRFKGGALNHVECVEKNDCLTVYKITNQRLKGSVKFDIASEQGEVVSCFIYPEVKQSPYFNVCDVSQIEINSESVQLNHPIASVNFRAFWYAYDMGCAKKNALRFLRSRVHAIVGIQSLYQTSIN